MSINVVQVVHDLILALGRQEQADLLSLRPSWSTQFQICQNYIEKPCLQKEKEIPPIFLSSECNSSSFRNNSVSQYQVLTMKRCALVCLMGLQKLKSIMAARVGDCVHKNCVHGPISAKQGCECNVGVIYKVEINYSLKNLGKLFQEARIQIRKDIVINNIKKKADSSYHKHLCFDC